MKEIMVEYAKEFEKYVIPVLPHLIFYTKVSFVRQFENLIFYFYLPYTLYAG